MEFFERVNKLDWPAQPAGEGGSEDKLLMVKL